MMDLIPVDHADLPPQAHLSYFDDASDLAFYRRPGTDIYYSHSHDEGEAWLWDGSAWYEIPEAEFLAIRNYLAQGAQHVGTAWR